ncbi:hypothetical protein [Streptomyces sp. NBC_00878]|uniref:hypothetical protein n=1 Tax=Streptomyces sp. NBC_00878 TaxID=2975854 RepID=UPI00225A7CD5|nr:hypothetical protein [Streptomyces sp. NBC_00878]MCX4904887.1 hypothetical protein [Streptomyces sp. NBC_00878]
MSADTGPALAPRGVRKVFTTLAKEMHTAVSGLGPTVGRGGFVAVVDPTGCGRPATPTSAAPTLVSGLEDPLEREALVPDESLDQREGQGPRDSVVFVTHTPRDFMPLSDECVVLTAGPITVQRVLDNDLPRAREDGSVSLRPRSSPSTASVGRTPTKRSASPARGMPPMRPDVTPGTLTAPAAAAITKRAPTVSRVRGLEASDRRVTRQVVIGSATPRTFTSRQAGFGFALIGAIPGESIGMAKGIALRRTFRREPS